MLPLLQRCDLLRHRRENRHHLCCELAQPPGSGRTRVSFRECNAQAQDKSTTEIASVCCSTTNIAAAHLPCNA
eukprot:353449-Rhodomonas_salina.1